MGRLTQMGNAEGRRNLGKGSRTESFCFPRPLLGVVGIGNTLLGSIIIRMPFLLDGRYPLCMSI